MDKKLNTLSLSGLMIGPVLGSGIVLLPPMALYILGDQAIFAWIITMLLCSVFAYVFTKMSLLAPSNEGVSVIIGENLGKPFRELSSNYLTAAVCFGPVAVMFTASDFICGIFPAILPYKTLITLALLLLGVVILLMGITAIGGLTLVLSSLTAVLLGVGSIYSLVIQPVLHFPSALPGIGKLGSTLLLLFWSIIGWEVIGNYVEEVNNPGKTIMRAMKISLTAVVLIYLLSTFALQNALNVKLPDGGSGVGMSLVLVALLGNSANSIMGIIATGLCFCTLIMILGAVTRQMAARAEAGTMPAFFRKKEGERSPKKALLVLTLFHCLLIILVHFGIIDIQWIIGIANTFFISNALLGLVASLKCFRQPWLKGLVLLLILSLCFLLVFSSAIGWGLLAVVTLYSVRRNWKTNISEANM